MDCMGELIKKLRGDSDNGPAEKINEGEADEMVILLFACKWAHLWGSADNI